MSRNVTTGIPAVNNNVTCFEYLLQQSTYVITPLAIASEPAANTNIAKVLTISIPLAERPFITI